MVSNGKIISFKETEDGRYLIELKGLIRFKIIDEFTSNKKYREFKIDYKNFEEDLSNKKEDMKFNDLELIFKDLKSLLFIFIFLLPLVSCEKKTVFSRPSSFLKCPSNKKTSEPSFINSFTFSVLPCSR